MAAELKGLTNIVCFVLTDLKKNKYTTMIVDPEGLLTGYAGSSPPGPMIYWLGNRGGTPWDRLGGALPVNTMTQPSLSYTKQQQFKIFGLVPTWELNNE